MLKLKILMGVLLSTTLLACNESKGEPKDSTQTQWRFNSYSCAFGCDPMLEEVLKPRIGDVLDLTSPKTGFDLFSECGGTLSLKVTNLSRDELLQQLNQTVPPNQRFSKKNTGLTKSTLDTAIAICNENGKSSSTFWVVSLSEETMKVYFEGASFLNFKAIETSPPIGR